MMRDYRSPFDIWLDPTPNELGVMRRADVRASPRGP